MRASEKHVTITDASNILSVSVDTIRRWEKKGLIQSKRSSLNYRLFDISELERIKEKISGSSKKRKFRILKGKKSPFNVIELFSGCGGLALGLENAGLRTELLVEIDKDCVSTLRMNRKSWNTWHDDIKNLEFSNYKDKVDIVAGGFPCQAFSYAGHSLGFNDTRGTLFFEFAKCIQAVQPKIVLAENVKGLHKHDNGRTLQIMLNTLDEIGYHNNFMVLRAQFLDVAQKRERLIILGLRKDLGNELYFPKEKNYYISLGEALAGCPISQGSKYPKRKKEIMAKVPPGGYWKDLDPDIQKEYMMKSYYLGGGKTGMARRLSMDEPSLTLTCNPAQKQTERCHPTKTRPLTVREYARVQSFPDKWQFSGSIASQYKQIGNAVPVNMAYHIGRCLIGMLNNGLNPQTMVMKHGLNSVYSEV